MAFTPGSGANIPITVDGAASSRRDIDSVGDALRRLNAQEFARLNSQVSAVEASIGGLQSSIASFAEFALASISVGMFADMIKGSIDALDNLNDLHKTTGITVADLSGLKLAAKQSGGDLDSIASAVNKLSVSMGKDPERFRRLGVSAREPIEAFKQLADVYSVMDNQQQKSALAADVLGRKWEGAAPLLSEGGKKIGEMVDRGKQLSAVTQEMADKADEFNDRMAEMEGAVDGAKMKLVGGMLPALTNVANACAHALETSGKLQAVWVALGAVGAFAFTDEFSSNEIKIKNVRASLSDLETDLKLSKSVQETGYIGRMLFGAGGARIESAITAAKARIKEIQDQIDKPAADAKSKTVADAKATAAASAAKDAKAASDKAAEFLKASEAANKARLTANLELTSYGIEVDRAKRAEGLSAVAELNRQGLASDAQYYVAKYNAAIAAGVDTARVKSAEISVLSSHHTTDVADQIATNGKIRKLNAEKNEALRASLVTAAQIRTQYLFDSGAAARAAQAAADSEVDAVNKEVVALQAQYDSYGKLPAAITAATIAKLQARSVALETNEGTVAEINNTNRLIEALKDKAKWEANVTAQGAGTDLARANELLTVMSALDDAARQAASGMAEAFGSVGAAIGGMSTALSGFARNQAAVAAQLAAARDGARGDPAKLYAAEQRASEAMSQAQVQQYGDMARAAASFFDKNSTGYKVMHTTEQAFRAYEMAMALQSMAKKIFFKEGEVAANLSLNATKIAGEAGATAVSTGLAATESSAWGITAVVKALASLPFPLNLAAGAATLAAVVAVGATMLGGIGGGAGDTTAKDRQDAAGTGTVLGDSTAKTDSIAKSLSMIEKNSYMDMNYSSGMLDSLRKIESGIGGLGNLVTRSTGSAAQFSGIKTGTAVAGGNLGLAAGTVAGGIGGAAVGTYYGMAAGSVGGPIGMAIGAVIGAAVGFIASKLTNVKTNIVDQGIALSTQSLGDTIRNGVAGTGYADVNTKKSIIGITYSNSTDRQTAPLSDEIKQQFTSVISGLRAGVLSAADALGAGGAEFVDRLDAIAIAVPNISLNGLSGEQVQKALETTFSALGDNLAHSALGGLESFQKVGEGYLETLVRVASDYQAINAVFASFGTTFGQVGLASVGARERLIELSGGLDSFTSQAGFFLKNFFNETEQAAAVKKQIQPTLSQYGLSADGPDAMKQFRDYVVGLDKTSEAGATAYAVLMRLAPSFKQVADSAADAQKQLADSTAAAQKKILDERKGLQDQIDNLTMSSSELLAKQRDALDASNRGLFDNIQTIKEANDAIAKANDSAAAHVATLTAATVASNAAVQASMQSFGSAVADSMKNATEAAKALREFNSALLLSSSSPLDLQSRRDLAASNFATAKDQASATAFVDAAKALRDSGGSGLAFAQDFASVQSALLDQANEKDAYAARLPDFYRSALTMFSVGAHANGGIANGWSIVGENGPELANFTQPARIYTAPQTRAALGGSNDSSTTDEIKQLRLELEAALGAIAIYTRATAKKLERLAPNDVVQMAVA
jgi:hypothetical protein